MTRPTINRIDVVKKITVTPLYKKKLISLSTRKRIDKARLALTKSRIWLQRLCCSNRRRIRQGVYRKCRTAGHKRCTSTRATTSHWCPTMRNTRKCSTPWYMHRPCWNDYSWSPLSPKFAQTCDRSHAKYFWWLRRFDESIRLLREFCCVSCGWCLFVYSPISVDFAKSFWCLPPKSNRQHFQSTTKHPATVSRQWK